MAQSSLRTTAYIRLRSTIQIMLHGFRLPSKYGWSSGQAYRITNSSPEDGTVKPVLCLLESIDSLLSSNVISDTV